MLWAALRKVRVLTGQRHGGRSEPDPDTGPGPEFRLQCQLAVPVCSCMVLSMSPNCPSLCSLATKWGED